MRPAPGASVRRSSRALPRPVPAPRRGSGGRPAAGRRCAGGRRGRSGGCAAGRRSRHGRGDDHGHHRPRRHARAARPRRGRAPGAPAPRRGRAAALDGAHAGGVRPAGPAEPVPAVHRRARHRRRGGGRAQRAAGVAAGRRRRRGRLQRHPRGRRRAAGVPAGPPVAGLRRAARAGRGAPLLLVLRLPHPALAGMRSGRRFPGRVPGHRARTRLDPGRPARVAGPPGGSQPTRPGRCRRGPIRGARRAGPVPQSSTSRCTRNRCPRYGSSSSAMPRSSTGWPASVQPIMPGTW